MSQHQEQVGVHPVKERPVFFTADTHFGHANIIPFCNRPFQNIEEMDEALVGNWNAVVPRNAIVWHLGDFCFHVLSNQHGIDAVRSMLSRLHGEKRLILGNHDLLQTKKYREAGFMTVDQLRVIKVQSRQLVLCHYAMLVWPNSHRGAWQLYGHSHGCLEKIDRLELASLRPGGLSLSPLSLDVGVDAWNYMPVSFEQIAAIMQERKERWDECCSTAES